MEQVFRFDIVLTTLVISFLFFLWKNKWEKRFVLVHQAFVGLKYVKGIYVETLPPGRYRLNPIRDSITPVYMGVQYLNVAGQDILTQDRAQIKMSALVAYQVADAPLAIHQQENIQQIIYWQAQLVLREHVQQLSLDDCFSQTQNVQAALCEELQTRVQPMGIAIQHAYVKDLMLSGELKRAYHQLLLAQKESQVALERARGEQATLRSLANAARQCEKNPALMQLRWLQAIEQSKTPHTLQLSFSQTPEESRSPLSTRHSPQVP
jgi:regulator of protease activity HflC (stomatin/prohibitin superfamily)